MASANFAVDWFLDLKQREMKETFNIKVGYGKKEVTLTILETEDYYKVIYFGGIMGAVRCVDGEWDLISLDELPGGDLPQYSPDLNGDRLEIVLDELTVDAIGAEIESYQQDEES